MNEDDDPHAVTDIAALERIYPLAPAPAATIKVLDRLSPAYRRIVEAASFAILATNGPRGIDCSPRGDAAGFIAVLDDRRIAIPDRRGNNRLDTLRNVLADPRVGLIFFVPGMNEALRITGRARLTADPALCGRLAVDGKAPATAMIVEIDTVYFQCARAVLRARLWDRAAHVDRQTLPSAGDMLTTADPSFDGADYDKKLPGRQAQTLY
ncbi:MAG: pyridoxamine 5'-phosphate oxidase family protein [Flavobacteriaceae bacterium]